MTMSPIRVAVIGLGAWGTLAHLPSLRAHPDAEVVAVVERDERRLHQIAGRFGAPLALSTPDELWRQPDAFDAVVIATPTDTHHAIALPALALGKHVLCEKPLAFDVDQAQAMADAARTAGVVTKLGFMFRFSPAIQRLKALLDEGYVGEVVAFQSHTMNAQFIDPVTPIHWKMRRERASGGVFAEYGAHAIDLAAWLVGPIDRVVAQARTATPQRPDASGAMVAVDVDDAAAWLATFASGAQGSFETSWSTLPVGGGGVRVYGTRGSLAWQPDPGLRTSEQLIGATIDHPEPKVLLEFPADPDSRDTADEVRRSIGISAEYNDQLIASFLSDIRIARGTGPDFADGRRAQAVLAAIQRSLGTQEWESVRAESGG